LGKKVVVQIFAFCTIFSQRWEHVFFTGACACMLKLKYPRLVLRNIALKLIIFSCARFLLFKSYLYLTNVATPPSFAASTAEKALYLTLSP
jgi:hypothetical protein